MKHSVLLVDDEILFADSLAERLEMRDFEVNVAYNGLSALDLFSSLKPGLVILDLRLPDIDGSEVLLHMKKLAPRTRVVVITGHGSDEDRKRCLDLGAAAFMNKPVRLAALVEALVGEGT
jgi:DNA-binding response OmpR family regulator